MATRYILKLFCRSCDRQQKFETKSKQPRRDNDKKAADAGWHAGRCPKCNGDMAGIELTDEQLALLKRPNAKVSRDGE